MEPNSPTSKLPRSRQILEAQVRDCYGRVVYSHKTHEKCADMLLARLAAIKIVQIILAAVSAGGFLAVIAGIGIEGQIAGAVVSTALLVINAYTKDYDLGEIAQKHKHAAADLWLIRERYLSLLTDIIIGDGSLTVLQNARDEITDELHAIYTGAPCTTPKAYVKAREALQMAEELTFSDTEIDALLPSDLRRKIGPQAS